MLTQSPGCTRIRFLRLLGAVSLIFLEPTVLPEGQALGALAALVAAELCHQAAAAG